jgi:hypothetical protein
VTRDRGTFDQLKVLRRVRRVVGRGYGEMKVDWDDTRRVCRVMS